MPRPARETIVKTVTVTTTKTQRVYFTDRDWWALRFCAEQYTVRLDQLGELFALWPPPGYAPPPGVHQQFVWSTDPSKRTGAAWRIAKRWQIAGFARLFKQDRHEPGWVIVTSRGMQELGLPYASDIPLHERRRHIAAVTQVRLLLAQRRPSDIWVSERQIRAQLADKSERALPHVPDGLLRNKDKAIAIEVELTAKGLPRLVGILEELTGRYPQTWYFVAPQIERHLTRAVSQLIPEQRAMITIFQLEQSRKNATRESAESSPTS